MQMSEQRDKILPAFAECLGLVVKPKKSKTNPHLKSNYADLESVNKAIGAALDTCGLIVTQPPYHEPGQPKDVVMIETVIIHAESGQWLSSILQIPLAKADAQGTGSAITYARRYAKLAIFDLLSSDDDGEKAAKSTKDWLRDVDQCKTEDDVQRVAKAARATGDAALFNVVKDKCAERVAKIRAENAKGFNPSKPANAEPGRKTVTVDDAPNNEPAPQDSPIDHEAESFNNEGF